MGPSPCWRYYGARKSTTKSSLLGVKWLWLIQFSFFNVKSGQPSNLVASYLDYIRCTKYFIINYLCQFLHTTYLQYDLQDNIILYITSYLVHLCDSTPKQLFFKNHKWLEQVTNATHHIEIIYSDTFKTELQSLLSLCN